MAFRTILVSLATLTLRVCGESNTPTPTVSGPPPTLSVAPAQAEHGGVVAVSAGITAEVAPLPDGRVAAYVQTAAHQPVTNAQTVTLNVQKPDGTELPVQLQFDPTVGAYVGRPSELPTGQYPMEIGVQLQGQASPVQLVTPALSYTASAQVAAPTVAVQANVAAAVPEVPPPPTVQVTPQVQVAAQAPTIAFTPRHGGRLQRVGNHVVEIVPVPRRGVSYYWYTPEGTVIPPAQVQAPSLSLTVNGQARTVLPQIDGDHFIVETPIAQNENVVVGFPSVVVAGEAYSNIVLEPVPYVVVAAPTVAVVAPQPRTVVVESRPQVIVHQPPALVVGVPGAVVQFGGGVVVQGPAFGVGFDVRHGHGRGRGRGRGRGHDD